MHEAADGPRFQGKRHAQRKTYPGRFAYRVRARLGRRGGTPKTGGTLVIGSTQVPRHLNGAVQSGIATALPSAQLFASPLRFDADWKPQPYLAESWELSPDARALTLHLRGMRCSMTASR